MTPDRTPDRPATPDDVDEIAGGLPETELGTSWGDRPTWKVRGRGFLLRRAPHRTALDEHGVPLDDVLVVRVADEHVKRALVEDPDTPFFTIEHLDGSPAVLLRASEVHRLTHAELVEVITEAWACRAPKTLVRGLLDG